MACRRHPRRLQGYESSELEEGAGYWLTSELGSGLRRSTQPSKLNCLVQAAHRLQSHLTRWADRASGAGNKTWLIAPAPCLERLGSICIAVEDRSQIPTVAWRRDDQNEGPQHVPATVNGLGCHLQRQLCGSTGRGRRVSPAPRHRHCGSRAGQGGQCGLLGALEADCRAELAAGLLAAALRDCAAAGSNWCSALTCLLRLHRLPAA